MALNVEKELAALERMTVDQLRRRYVAVYGETTNGRNKPWLIKRIIWRVQVIEEGDLSERARRRAAELANDADLRMTAPRKRKRERTDGSQAVQRCPVVAGDARLPMPGTLLTRRYQGRTLAVKVLGDGFELEGETYKSLSAVAKAITGTHWNGYHFFGLRTKEAHA